MKKLFSLVLALAMIFALATTAMAATPETNKKIIIANPEDGQTYTAYKIFDLTKTATAVDGTKGSGYAYTINATSNPVWDVVIDYMNDDSTFEANSTAVKKVGNGITLTKSTEGDKWNVIASTLDAAAFAKHLNNNKDKLGTSAGTATFENPFITGLAAGYYFVDSTLGSLCALDTANEVSVYEKNSKPSITKQVQEDSDNSWKTKDAAADADFNQVVNFKLTVNTGTFTGFTNDNVDAGVGTQTGVDANYVIVDTLPKGMTYQNNLVVTVDSTTWTVGEGKDYTVTYKNDTTDGKDVLTITLLATGKLKDLPQNTDIILTYSAKLDQDAAVSGAANQNTVELTYHGEKSSDYATVKTYDVNVYKYFLNGQSVKQNLANAKFKLYKVVNGTTYYAVTETVANDIYMFKAWTTTESQGTTFVSPADGGFTIRGLDSNTYSLIETEAPAGYNVLVDPVDSSIAAANKQVDVENKTGIELPSTGGMGTTLFYTVGGIMVLAAGILLVTKKRMSGAEE